MHIPKVSVIMPAYNAERTITEAVNSVLNQTFSDLELIICDDASTDHTASLLNSYHEKRLKVIHNEINCGAGVSRDNAIEQAKGDWIAFIDADDAWTPDRLEVLLNAVKHSDDMMVFDNILECHDTPSGMVPWKPIRGSKPFGIRLHNEITYIPFNNFITSRRLLIKPLVPRRFIYSKSIRHGKRPESMEPVEDTDFFLKLIVHGMGLYYVHRPMYLYRITPFSAISQTKRHVMMITVLESAHKQFTKHSTEQKALEHKLFLVKRDAEYMAFISILKRKSFGKAFSIVVKAPRIMLKFIQHATEDAFYHTHRILHGAQARGQK